MESSKTPGKTPTPIADLDLKFKGKNDDGLEFGFDMSDFHASGTSKVMVKTPTGYRVLGTVEECNKMSQAELQAAFENAPEEPFTNERADVAPKFTPFSQGYKELIGMEPVARPSGNTPHGMNRCAQCNRLTKSPYLCKSCEGQVKVDPNKTVHISHNRLENN